METLQNLMKKVLADSFAFYLKAQNFHWNVEGVNFPQYHEFFGNVYQEVYGSIDSTAEQIRALDTYTPGSFTRFQELTDIEDSLVITPAIDMVKTLLSDNDKVLETLKVTFKLADSLDEQGLADYLAGRIDAHKKHGWMLRSITK